MTALRVAQAAIRIFGGRVYAMDPPNRHHDVMRLAAEQEGPERWECARSQGIEQGFQLSDGRFVNRRQAYQVARKAGQLLERAPTAGHFGHGLFSEDVW